MRICIAAVVAAAACTACFDPPVATPQTRVTQETPIRVPQNPQNKVDILFMVDNSLSMDAMQAEPVRPCVVEFFTWRYYEHCGHAQDDHLGYREEAEIAKWAKRDPLSVARSRL